MIHLRRQLQCKTHALVPWLSGFTQRNTYRGSSVYIHLMWLISRSLHILVSECPSSVNGSSGSFSSPHYPSNYLNNQRCSWGITVPSGYRVEVKFDTFRTYNDNDYLKIYDGSSNFSNSSSQFASLSGYQSIPRVYSSSGSSMWFSFYSDGSGTQKGFHANFTAITSSGTCNTVPYNRRR